MAIMAGLRARWEARLPTFGIWAALPTSFATEPMAQPGPVGEMGSGVRGAGRLNGNAVTETQVFGARAGEAARPFGTEAGRLPPHAEVLDSWRARLSAPATPKRRASLGVLPNT
jgi:succinate dehydrogenase/fumarate reductase flavoprotein subunit